MFILSAAITATALAGGARLDLSSQVPASRPVASRTHGWCADRADAVLAGAIVVYGRQGGRSAWGHISLRFLACMGGDFRDVEYEATVVDDTLVDWYADAFPGEDWYLQPDFLPLQRDRLVWFRNEDPVDTGLYRDELDQNREITELWMPGWSGPGALAFVRSLDVAYEAQLAELRAGRTVSRPRYRPFSDNCTLPVHAAAAALGVAPEPPDSPFPMAWLRALEDHPQVQVVVHPSPGMLRWIEGRTGDLKAAWSGAPTEVYRPLLRGTLPEAQLEAFRARVSENARPLAVEWAMEGWP